MDDIILFWNRVNSLIKERNLTQKKVSLMCNSSPRRIQGLSTNQHYPNAKEIVDIARVLGTTAEFLVYGEEQSKASAKEEIINSLKELEEQIKTL